MLPRNGATAGPGEHGGAGEDKGDNVAHVGGVDGQDGEVKGEGTTHNMNLSELGQPGQAAPEVNNKTVGR